MTCSFYDVPCHASWLVLQLEAFGSWLWELVLSGSAALLEVVPVPDFLLNLSPVNIPSGVMFFGDMFNIEYGITILITAYTARFIVRRIPVIG
jgi:hypothetical protein